MAGKADKTEGKKQVPLQVFVDDELKQRLRKYCFEKDERQSPVLREAIDAYLKQRGYYRGCDE